MTGKGTWKQKRPRKNTYRPPSAWQRSLTFKEIARNAIIAFNKQRARLPKCGAKTRTTGDPCRNPALENGRCRLHGGATPKGSEWGKRQITSKPPSQRLKSDWQRVEKKLQRQAREDADRARRLRKMTDAEFWRYLRRLGRRRDDPLKSAFQTALREEIARRGPDPNNPNRLSPLAAAPSPDPELTAIENRIAELRDELERRRPLEGVFA